MMKCNSVNLSIINKKEIVKDLSFVLNCYDKLAIIGEEGNGKSTLLKYFYKLEDISNYTESSGSFYPNPDKLGYLPQILESKWNLNSIIDFLFKEDIDCELNYDYYNEYNKIERLFTDFKIDYLLENDYLIKNLSGGEKIKIQIIKLLMRNPEGLLLDEPTNDIDLETLNWLENYLSTVKIPIIFISHDISFLSKVSTHILHLEQIKRKTEMKWTLFNDGYQEYIQFRQASQEKQILEHTRTKREKNKKEEILAHQHQLVENDLNKAVRNPSAGRVLAKKMKSINSQEKKLDNYVVTESPQPEEGMNFFFENINFPNNKVLIDINNMDIKIGNITLIKNLEFQIIGPKHIVITGANGSGKTTLIKYLLEVFDEKKINYGYMPQNYEDGFDSNETPISYLQKYVGYDNITLSKIMSYLGAMKFLTEEMQACINTLSGGLKAKFYILKMMMISANVLILDEPTRNLSPLSIPVVLKSIKDYGGAIISVSHDREYIKIMDEIFEIQDLKLIKKQVLK